MRALQLSVLCFLLQAFAPVAAEGQLSPQEVHDRIVRVYSDRVPVSLPPGDTFISWYRAPVLLHTVRIRVDTVATGMVRADSMSGIDQVVWSPGGVESGDVVWRQADSVLLRLRFSVDGQHLVVSGSRTDTVVVPGVPWAVVDFGMEDQEIPLLRRLPPGTFPTQIALYRPYADKWDTLTVTASPVGDGILYSLRGSPTSCDFLLVSASGSLLQLRRQGQDFERRPLEQTPLVAEYRRLRAKLPPN